MTWLVFVMLHFIYEELLFILVGCGSSCILRYISLFLRHLSRPMSDLTAEPQPRNIHEAIDLDEGL